MKKMIALLASGVLCLNGISLCPAMLPVAAAAEDIVASGECGADGDNLTWTLDSDGTLTISGEGEMADWKYDITSYKTDAPWNKYSSDVKKIQIEASVTSIGDYAFRQFSHLTSVTISESMTGIGNNAFEHCINLTSVTIPDSVTSIGYSAFSECTSLTSITIPASVTSFGGKAFYNTPWLKAKQEENPLVVVNNILIDGTACSGDVTIPNSVTGIENWAFANCTSLSSITIPNSVTNIGGSVFFECTGLTSITIPDSVTSIGQSAFLDCSSLNSITIPDSVTSIGGFAFDNTPWIKAKQEENPLVIVNNILINGETCPEDVTIPDSVTSIGDYAFHFCDNITSITLPESVTSIGYLAFYYCDCLTDIIINNPNCKMDDYIGAFPTIHGYTGSTAEEYATKFGRRFESLGDAPSALLPGDVHTDGSVDVIDAQMVLRAAVQISIGKETGFTAEQMKAADVNKDGTVNVADAQLILTYYLYNTVVDTPKTWEQILAGA